MIVNFVQVKIYMMLYQSFTEYCFKKIWRGALLIAACCLFMIPNVHAHEGPPFAIIVDEEVGPYLVSVWTDPDIGIGTFYVVFEPKNDDHEIDDIESVKIGTEPVTGWFEEEIYEFEPQPARSGARYWTEVEFPKGEFYKVRFTIEGDGFEAELHEEVEATPDGSIGPIGLLIYALPFVGIGILWFRAIIVRRRHQEDE